ncbi:MAG: 50S ribosomal protein L11 methyltransferase [Thermodesulfobacteriota bacterium]|nr:50S ribosomal protein L11 methyltransferase [Thermodesulfobacteriota bacterium]
MTEKWLEITLCVPVATVDLLCYELNELGSVGVVVEQRELDAFIPPDPEETDGETFTIKAYFENSMQPQVLQQQISQRLEVLAGYIHGLDNVDINIGEMAQQDWAEDWKQHFSTTKIGSRLVIKPSWEEYLPQADDVVVTLDPGMAFGTGTHGTTHLCLETLAALFEAKLPPNRILDVGTGSGILAIAAAALGSKEIVACDIDSDACDTARANIAQNGFSESIEVTDTLLEGLPHNFDVILANILAEENIRLAVPLVERLAPGGTLILSGILDEKVALVTAAFERFDLTDPQLCHEQEWACIVYTRSD